MHIEKLELTHQSLLAARFAKLQIELSEYTFANLYLFRDVHDYQIIFSKCIYVAGKTRDGRTYIMPTCPPKELLCDEIETLLHQYEFLFPIPPNWLNRFSPRIFQSEIIDGDSDYLYTTEKLAKFPGRHLSSRRNLLKQFKELYPDHRSVALTSENVADAQRVLEEWQKHATADLRKTDFSACREGLQLLESLKLSGHLTYVDGQPVGFVLGEPLTSTTYVIHFAKGLTQFKGVYQYLYNEFASHIDPAFHCINLEQDLGSAELAHAKRSYHPDTILPKFRIKCK